MITRQERADRLRPAVRQAIAQSNLREVAQRVGVSHTAVHKFASKGETPFEATLEKYEQWAEREGLELDLITETDTFGAADEAEQWLAKIANPDMLRRQAGTPTGRDLIKGIKSFLFDLPWPVEQKNAVDALLNRIAADAEKPET